MKKILIVDDSRTIEARLAKELQRKIDCEIIQADTRQLAMQRINKHKDIQLALLDLNLPDAPNGEIVELVMKFNIPIIILTGDESKITKEIMSKQGVIDYVIKDRSYAIEQAANMAHRFLNNKNHKALIIDDSKTFAFKLENICKRYNLQAVVSNNAEDAIEIVKADKDIDIIFVDYIMPGMNGLEFTSEIRKTYKQDEISIIALSGASDKEVIPRFLKYGANDFVSKDFSEEELIARMGTQLNNIELFSETKDKANKDYMTGMFNRRYMFEVGTEMYERAKNRKEDFAVAIIDIDKFKNINDTYGHDIGDIAIKEIANVLPKFINEDSLIARMGGEEFCLLLKNRDEKKVIELLNEIREFFQTNVITIDRLHLSYTVSIGVTTNFGENLDDMLKNADLGLYDAKESGRNKLILKG